MSVSTYPRVACILGLLAWVYGAGGCVQKPSKSTAGDAGDAGTAGSGVHCGADPVSGVTLCSGTTLCPGAVLDANELPGCGYRTLVPSFDLECVCNGTDLCPIGVAATCADVSTLLTKRTLVDICNQVGAGTCKDVSRGSGTGTGGGSSTCDRGCAADCAGSAVCLQGCGC